MKFYITTAIDYVNAEPHIGHAYQKIIGDIFARWHKLKGDNVFFLTGTDEHGQKIDRKAKDEGKNPKEFCDFMAEKFEGAWKNLNIDFDRFFRTTDKDHEKFVSGFVKKVYEKGDIYKGVYEGLYCVPCETFYTEKSVVNNICPIHKKPLERVKEDTYYFRLSKYQKRLLELYEKHPEFVLPEERRNEIKNRVKEGLQDLSITRTSFTWGIPFEFEKGHVLYVWFEALLCYLTGAGKKQEYWPATLQILGKDNGWFHAVIFPAMLFSAGYVLPKTVFIHGFLTVNGEKISKTAGNVISPQYLSDKYGADAVRYFVAKQFPFGEDGDFSEAALVQRNNGELANDLGNLVSRVITLAAKHEYVKKNSVDKKLAEKLDIKKIEERIERFELHHALEEVWRFIGEVNKHINDEKPWAMEEKEQQKHMYTLLEAVRIISIIVSPFIPETSGKINKQLNVNLGVWKECKFGVVKEYKVKKGEILFKKVL